MTAYELAAKLLAGEDLPVAMWVYTGGNDELEEIEGITVYETAYIQPTLVLQTYKEPK